jgi:hypothetical protein
MLKKFEGKSVKVEWWDEFAQYKKVSEGWIEKNKYKDKVKSKPLKKNGSIN